MQLPNTRVFDETAVGWGAAIDKSIQKERYLRGKRLLTQLSTTFNLKCLTRCFPAQLLPEELHCPS